MATLDEETDEMMLQMEAAMALTSKLTNEMLNAHAWERAFLAALTGRAMGGHNPDYAATVIEQAARIADEAVKVMAERRGE